MNRQILVLTISCCLLAGWISDSASQSNSTSQSNSAGQSNSTSPDEISLREDLRVLRAIAEDGAVPRATRAQATIKALELGQLLQDPAVTREWALRFVSEFADTDAAITKQADFDAQTTPGLAAGSFIFD